MTFADSVVVVHTRPLKIDAPLRSPSESEMQSGIFSEELK